MILTHLPDLACQHKHDRPVRFLFIQITLAFIFLICTSHAAFSSETATFPRHPSLSPNGEYAAFSYGGDIWRVPTTGGRALRLTVHAAYEGNPHWSPDGQWIAFNSDREGNKDVFIIPAEGGQSKRLTYFDSDSRVNCWTPDSRGILFTSRRDDRYPDYNMIYRIPINSGMPVPVMRAFGGYADLSHEGNSVLFVHDGVSWWRKHYRGSASGQVWRYNLETGDYSAVTDTTLKKTGADFKVPSSGNPLWGGDGSVYVVSDRDGTWNLWKRDKRQKWSQITHYKDDGVRFPSIAFDGNTVAYEHETDIYLIHRDGEPEKLNIIAPLDDPFQSEIRREYNNNADRVAFGPNERQLFVEVRGEVFAGRIVGEETEAARGRANSLTGNTPFRDGDFTISAGGDSVLFVSDRDGNRNLYLTYSDDPETTELARAQKLKTEQLTFDPAEDHRPLWSPDERYVAFLRGKGDLYILDMKKHKERLLLPGWSMLRYVWSPDGKWIAYAREDNEYNSDVFILSVEEGWSVNISRHPDEDDFPVWSADGKKLGFKSRRRNNNWDIYFVFLDLSDHRKSLAQRAEESYLKGDPKKKDEKKQKDDEEVKLPEIVIDTTDIYRRIYTVTSLPGEEGIFDISPDGENFVFLSDFEGDRDLYSIKWTGKDQKRLTNGGRNPRWINFSPDGKDVRFLGNNGKAGSVSLSGGKAKDYPFSAVVLINVIEERKQKFNELWRGLNEQFYDSNFHGNDWQALHDKYLALIPAASTEDDFGDIVRMLMGELNASHMGYNSPHDRNRHSVGKLGLDFDYTDEGEGLLIDYILPYGCCDRKELDIKPGDRLTAINGIPVGLSVNIHEILDHQASQRIDLNIKTGKKERRITVEPMNGWTAGYLRYDDWVQGRRDLVHTLSDGKLGYVHIRGMGWPSLARFEAQLFSEAHGREGLVIDVRNNGGGSITDQLLAMLQVKRHAITYPRDGGPGYPQGRLPMYSWVKPISVLCNQHSFSNAEIFSHAIKTLNRGTLTGVPTPGGVISTGWEGLIDGSGYRIPLRGWYVGDDLKQEPSHNMEGNGAVPDIIIPMRPEQINPGDDEQIKAAVEELLQRLK